MKVKGLLFASVAAAAIVSVFAAPSRADIVTSTASTDAAVFGGATPSVSSNTETYNLRGYEDAAGYTQTAVVFAEFSITDSPTISDASFNFDYKRNNSGITLNVYGLNDGDTWDTAWNPSSIEFDAGAVNTPGAASDGGSPINPIVDPARTTFLGTITLDKNSATAEASFTDDNAAGVTGATALSDFLAADTNGTATLLLVATATGPFIYSATSSTPETLVYTEAPAGGAVPEPASLSILGACGAGLLLRRRSIRQ